MTNAALHLHFGKASHLNLDFWTVEIYDLLIVELIIIPTDDNRHFIFMQSTKTRYLQVVLECNLMNQKEMLGCMQLELEHALTEF